MKPVRPESELREAYARDEALSLLELAHAGTGYSYHAVRAMAKEPGFPLKRGRVVPSLFKKWLAARPSDAEAALAA